MTYEQSELILNEDGSIFHLKLKPEDIADNILLVGDPGRVDLIAGFLKNIEIQKQNREFKTVTGYYNNTKVTVISTGIGTDNIDIVINELDALANINLETRQVKENHRKLNFIRIGTSGALQEDIPVNSFVISDKSIGFDNLLHFYDIESGNTEITEALKEKLGWSRELPFPYVVDASKELTALFANRDLFIKGVNISSPGFYGPQGRTLRIPLAYQNMNNNIKEFEFKGLKITNYEMESSAIYILSKQLNHNALTICAIIANRVTKKFAGNYKPIIKNLVKEVLETLTKR